MVKLKLNLKPRDKLSLIAEEVTFLFYLNFPMFCSFLAFSNPPCSGLIWFVLFCSVLFWFVLFFFLFFFVAMDLYDCVINVMSLVIFESQYALRT